MMPYRWRPTGYERLRYGKTDANMQSAGGLVTTLEDEARWLEANLNAGYVDGKQVLPAAAFREAHKVQAQLEEKRLNVQLTGYALGWNVGRFRDGVIYTHGGGFPGFATHMSFMPERRIGIVAMANTGDTGGGLVEIVAQAIYDVLAGAEPASADSLAVLQRVVERQRAGIQADLDRRAARPQTTPLPFAAYAGRYESPAMGSLELTLNGSGKLEAKAGVAWSVVEVYDGTKQQLRVELFGSGSVLAMELEGDRVVGAGLGGVKYRRVSP